MGFVSAGKTCNNINECENGRHQCDLNAMCVDKDPASADFFGIKYVCACRSGWTGEGTKCNPCMDINECETQPGICGLNSECTNTPGSYTCKCKEGFEPGPTSSNNHNKDCINTNECLKPLACLPNSLCNDTTPGYECPCIPGYVGEGKIMGCTPDPAVCKNCSERSTECLLNPAGTQFGCECITNYTRFTEFECVHKKYCDKPNAVDCAPSPKGNCSDNPDGSGWTCKCNPGYSGDGKKCEEINICNRLSPCKYVANTICNAKEPNIYFDYTCDCKDKHVRQIEGKYNNSAPCFEEGKFMANNCTACDRETEVCRHPLDKNGKEDTKLWSCNCREGFARGIDEKCHNINECVKPKLNTCDTVRADCQDQIPTNENLNTTHTCTCKSGFTGKGTVNNCFDVNECNSTKPNGEKYCAKEGEVCKNLVPGFECHCKDGFIKKGEDCEDVNECIAYLHSCNAHSVCNNTIGNFFCTCDIGFRKNGTLNGQPTCESINQCVEGDWQTGNAVCTEEGEECHSFLGRFECHCKPGYQKLNGKCVDIDECREKQTHRCDLSTTECKNLPGTYACDCLEGYERETNVTCKDVNECATGNFSCHENSHCKNLHGSYRCICDDGFEIARNSLEKKPYCERIKICKKNPFICNSGNCIDLSEEPFFRCECPEGTVAFNNTMCIDSRYCDETDAWPCPEHSKCQKRCQCDLGYNWKQIELPLTLDKIKQRTCAEINWCATEGKKQCKNTKCRPTPQKGPGTGECFCDAGFELVDKKCSDINECIVNATICPAKSICDNTIGSYQCYCEHGYVSAQGSTPTNPICINVNECELQYDNCTSYTNTACKDTDGAFTCDCLPGYIRDQIGDDKLGEGRYAWRGCVDDDECLREVCHELATCENCDGSYSCKCPEGYSGVGTIADPCVDVDECALNIHNCSLLQNCKNKKDGFECECKPGYNQRNGQCIDIDECLRNPCDNTTKCKNIPGSFLCNCKDGYVLNSKTGKCDDKNECSYPDACPQGPGDYCNNTVGSYQCLCLNGFEKPCQGKETKCKQACKNINECVVKSDKWGCGPGTNCTDTIGDYKCICKNFHTGDPYSKEGCKYVDICSREPCKGPNEVCAPANEQVRKCDCADGYVREIDTCKENPCKHAKCTGGHCIPQIFDNKLTAKCLCPSSMIYDKVKDECIPSDVCECGENIKNCTGSAKCTDPDHMYCFSRGTTPDCKCFNYMKYNNETKKCDEQDFCKPNPCPGHPFNATCTNVLDEITGLNKDKKCHCPPGYTWTRDKYVVFAPGRCEDDVNCSEENYCQNKPFKECDRVGHVCVCIKGYYLNNQTDECIKQDPCVLRSKTTGKPACPEHSYEDSRDGTCQCNCHEGYRKECIGQTETCVERKPCIEGLPGAENIDPCLHNRTHPECFELPAGKYMCTCGTKRQNYGTNQTTGECEPLDMCKQMKPVVCSEFEKCNSASGDCECNTGFERPCEECQCDPVNECKTERYDCMPNSVCKDLTPGYTCICSNGYEPVAGTYGQFNFTCQNKNECKENPCPQGSKCYDTEGSYRCECLPPLIQHGNHHCAQNKTEGCEPQCVKHAHCVKVINENSVFNCTCDYGYVGNGTQQCNPYDFCGLDKPCGPNSNCTNLQGDYMCTCLPGYNGNGKDKAVGCKKINYCQVQLNPCPKLSRCTLLDSPQNDYANTDPKAWTNCTCVSTGFDFNRNTFTCDDVNECTSCKNYTHCPCPGEATKCINTHGSYTCECPKGFTYDAKINKCIDINECLTSESASCQPENGICVNEIGSWSCECKPGRKNKLNKFSCELHYECGTEVDRCENDSSACRETYPGHDCICKTTGFVPHVDVKHKCFDRDECSLEIANCNPISEQCLNTHGGYKCECRAEYERDENGVCQPLVPCSEECPENAVCVNTRANVSTCKCHTGYKYLEQFNVCAILACDKDSCGPHSKCEVNQRRNNTGTQALHRCVCNTNYKLDSSTGLCIENRQPRSAEDVCKSVICGIGQCLPKEDWPGFECNCPDGICESVKTCEKKECDSNAVCVDPPVPVGSKPQHAYCQCKEGWTGIGTPSSPCYEENVCRQGLCSQHATCKMEHGQTVCHCDPHYFGNGTFCADVNECEPSISGKIRHNCDKYADCHNVQGGFNCICKGGFKGAGTQGDCEDINECLPSEGQKMLCDEVSTICNNTIGSYKCDCRDGFKNTSSEYKCEDIDECAEDDKKCGIHICLNTISSYECRCNMGYAPSADKKQCHDINECETKQADCHPKAECSNTIGSFACKCLDGYKGDGKNTCDLIDKCSDDSLNKCHKESTTCRMLSDRPVYKCDCKPGFTPAAGQSDYHSCDDIDECVDVNTVYDRTTTICTNKKGTYELSCKPGYENTHPNKNINATHNVLCTNLNECAQDPAFAETLARMESGKYNISDWLSFMVPPKDNSSAYALCFNLAKDGVLWSSRSVALPMCMDRPPTTTMALMNPHNAPSGFVYPKGYTCACPAGDLPMTVLVPGRVEYPECGQSKCNCDPGFVCRQGTCVCADPAKKSMKVGNSYTCDDRECGDGIPHPVPLKGKEHLVECKDGKFHAGKGYELVREANGAIQKLVDFNECAMKPNPCCNSDTCTGSDCVQCYNTEGSYECVLANDTKTMCIKDTIDENTCGCGNVECASTESWFYSCLKQCNATLDPRLDLPENNQKLCSRIMGLDAKFKTFDNLRELYVHVCAMSNAKDNNKYACFFDKSSDNLAASPLFNHWGECTSIKENVKCQVGTPQTSSVTGQMYCGKHWTLPNATPAIGQPKAQENYPYTVDCLLPEFLDKFNSGNFFVVEGQTTVLAG